jgi:molybdopterin-guanine dinucleotide biosynthesis protein A
MGGGDKTAIEVGGRPIVRRVKEALAVRCDPVVVVGPEAGGGPASAVASLGPTMEGFDVVVVAAGDLALLRADHVDALIDALGDTDAGACAAFDDRGLRNPLVAVHRAATLLRTIADIEPGDRADRLLPADTRGIQLDADATFSVNTPDDLEEARRRLSP